MDKHKLLQFLPTDEQNINRLLYLKDNAAKPRIAVFGKYNHGKSTLLNALVGDSMFKAADKRETTENKELEQEHVIWIDTPGLDADVHKQDDKAAIKGAFEMADYLFLVHQAQAGELDKYEMQIFQQLARQDKNYNRKMFLVLTQIDQKSTEEVSVIETKIRQQLLGCFDLRDLKIISVSAHRYNRGIKEDKAIFCEKSGINTLFDLTDTLVSKIDELRKKEMKRLKSTLLLDFTAQKEGLRAEAKGLQTQQNFEVNNLKRDANKLTEALV
jgi:small GTP-binding protein